MIAVKKRELIQKILYLSLSLTYLVTLNTVFSIFYALGNPIVTENMLQGTTRWQEEKDWVA